MADQKKKTVFETLNAINVNEHTEVKDTGRVKLTYLSWPWAWAEVKKNYPDANYEVEKFNGIPYAYDPLTGYMVYTKITIEGITHEMWLPVMDSQNKAMKSEPYQIQTRNSTITVQAATMFDINKTIMRCLVKNLAMFGLGLYIYAGEDLPEPVAEETIAYICNNCGSSFTDKKYADATMKKYGKHICPDCIQKKREELKAKKAAEEIARKKAEAEAEAMDASANNDLPFEF